VTRNDALRPDIAAWCAQYRPGDHTHAHTRHSTQTTGSDL